MGKRRGLYCVWVAFVALLPAALVAPLASATAVRPQAAPLSREFVEYQAELRARRVLGLTDFVGTGSGRMVPEPIDISYLKGARIAPPRAAYPASFDLRALGKVSSVKDQDPRGTCWAFAANASLESCLMPGELRDFSEDNLVLNSGFDSAGSPYDYGGNAMWSSAYFARWGGPVNESEDGYNDGYTPPGLSARKHVAEILYVPGGATATETDNLKYALTAYGAVVTSVRWDGAYYNAATASFCNPESGSVNHSVTIVGWDDTYSPANFVVPPPGAGAWLVKNSWGSAWGQGGYFWASYYDYRCGTSRARNMVFSGVSSRFDYTDLYCYDPLGEVTSLGYTAPLHDPETAWAANRFTAVRSEDIRAIGFFTSVPNATYTVYAGSSLALLQAKGSGSLAVPGYHTVVFSSPWPVTAGGSFFVAIRLTTPGDNWPIAVEYALPGYSSGATASLDQSFMRPDGGDWGDVAVDHPTYNVCIKAYGGAATAPTDTTAPVTTATGHTGTWQNCVYLTFSVTDPGAGASGVDYTSHQIDSGTPEFGSSVGLPRALDGSDDGAHTITWFSTDQDGNREAAQSLTVYVDCIAPRAAAKKATVRRGQICTLRFAVRDATSPKVTSKVTIKQRRKTLTSWKWPMRRVLPAAKWWTKKFRCKLKPGRYSICVTGKDLAGNSANVRIATLLVKR